MKIKRILSLLLAFTMIFALCSCKQQSSDSSSTSALSGDMLKLSFKGASSFDFLKQNNGKQVSIDGYLATSSPADGSFIFLMNLPYQSCPFCVPNTSNLSNTIECYPKKNKTFDYTNQAVRVTGTLEVSESEDEPFTDMYGYEFSFKITDSSYTIIDESELSDDMVLWQKLADTDIISEVYSMYNYVSFLCAWNTYYVNSYTDADGNKQSGYYLYASDALNFIQKEEGQYHYGYVDGYFDDIIKSVESVDKTAFKDLTDNIEKAKSLAAEALKELEDGNYSFSYQHVDMFDTYDNVYTIDKGDELASEMDELYMEFSNWLSNWEL